LKYLDADVLIHWATDHPKHGETATKIVKHIELNEKACTSALALYLFHLTLDRSGAEGYDVTKFFKEIGRLRNLKVLPVDFEALERGARAAKTFGVSLETGIQYVVAKEKGAEAVYSTNVEFDKTDLPRRFRP
jgi:predicted nucleic acid-binding protein